MSLQEVSRLAENDSGLDSPRADSECDLANSEFSTPELFQAWLSPLLHVSSANVLGLTLAVNLTDMPSKLAP